MLLFFMSLSKLLFNNSFLWLDKIRFLVQYLVQSCSISCSQSINLSTRVQLCTHAVNEVYKIRLAIKLLHQLAIAIAVYNNYIHTYIYTCIYIKMQTVTLHTNKCFNLYHISLINVTLCSSYCQYFQFLPLKGCIYNTFSSTII